MKRNIYITIVVVFIIVVLIGVIGFKDWSAKITNEAIALVDTPIDVSAVADGTYEGHSELGPVMVDVKVTVRKGKMTDVDIIKHQNGLGNAANIIAVDMVDKNTYEVDAVSGATVSSEVIMNAVNNALQEGVR